MIAVLVDEKRYLIMVLICISLQTDDIFMCLLVVCITFGGKCLVRLFLFLNWIICLFVIEL